ncbi:MAG: ATP-binding protein [Bacteroidales bacterium]|nr:ATP-binding protein [Bacteroidales bacterium]
MKREIKIASKIENVAIVENLIDEISLRYKIGAEVYGNVLIAIVEAVTNCIIHGNKLNAEKAVYIKYEIEDKELIFAIKDEGEGFDFSKIPDPTKPTNVEKPHGRGVFLMIHLADKLEFNKEGTEVTLKFKL